MNRAAACSTSEVYLPGGLAARWRLGLETGRVEARRQEPFRRTRAVSLTANAMEGVKSPESASLEELSGVEGAERSDRGGGKLGGPPRAGSLRQLAAGSVASYDRC